jgi:DNA polymerase III alpha subunit (gram-positive type)
MKALEKELRGHDCLIFLDLEGTQFSHEMIEIGAYKVYLNKDQTVKKIFDGYTSYVKAKAKVGRVVTNLTGITDEKIKKDGVPFRVIQQGFRKYVGKDWGKCLYVTFGSHDLRIIMQSADNNMDASMEEARYVTHNAFDLSEFISRFIKDDNGNSLSLTNYLKVFNVPFEGQSP